jgi:hypothetical protein
MSRGFTPTKGFKGVTEGFVGTFRSFGDSVEGFRDSNGSSGFSPLDLAGLQAFYDISDISSLFQDSTGLTPVTTTLDPVGRVNDLSGNGNDFTQPGSASIKPTYTVNGSDKYLSFDGADWMSILSSTALFKYLHDGTGCTVLIGVRFGDGAPPISTDVLLSSYSLSSSQTGLAIYFTAGNRIKNVVGKGVSFQYPVNDGPVSNDFIDTNLVFGFTYESPNYASYADSVSIDTGTQSFTPSSGNASANLALGASGGSIPSLEGRFAVMTIYNRVLDQSEIDGVSNFISLRMS